MRKIFLLGLGPLLGLPAHGSAAFPADHAFIQYTGRIDKSKAKQVRFDWPGCSILARFTGPSVSVRLSGGNNDFNVFIDGAFKSRISLETGRTEYAAAQGLPDGEHTLLLTKRTEGHYGVATFGGLILADGHALLPPPPRPASRILFIGDSYTAGYGNEASSVECAELRPWDNNYAAYGPVTARAAGAEYSVQAFSGLGMVHNYNDPSPLSKQPFPFFFDRTLSGSARPKWDFSSWIPHLVVVALGTNDFSTAVKPTQAQYTSAYAEFLARIRGHYPAAEILCVTYPVDEFQGRYVEALVKALNGKGEAKVHWVSMPALDPSKDLGCDWHPNVSGHRKYSEALLPAVRRHLPP